MRRQMNLPGGDEFLEPALLEWLKVTLRAGEHGALSPSRCQGQCFCQHCILKSRGRGTAWLRAQVSTGLGSLGACRQVPSVVAVPAASPDPRLIQRSRLLGSWHVSSDAIAHSSLFSLLLFLGAGVLVIYELFGEAANTTYALYTCLVCST